jgi:aldehyde dehydrogenase (NAD+)
LAETIQGNGDDVDVAVKAAKEAHTSWSQLPGHVRARHIYSLARHVQKHHRLIAGKLLTSCALPQRVILTALRALVVEALDNGKPVRETRDADHAVVTRWLYYYAGWAQLLETELPQWTSVGVVGGIVAWNFPLMLLVWKVAPALAAGNTIVMKPATYTRLSALLFAEICAEAGLPPGVVNVLTGSGSMGSKMAEHPDVDKVCSHRLGAP